MLSFILTGDGGCRQDVGDRVGEFQGPTRVLCLQFDNVRLGELVCAR